MTDTEPDSLAHSPEILDPPRKTRAALWFGIYFAAQLPLISVIGAFYLFPTGLFRSFFPTNGEISPSVGIAVIVVPYVVYLVHLIASLNVRSRTTFQMLLVILFVMVVMNLVGCKSMLDGLHNIH